MATATPKSYHDSRGDVRFPTRFRALLHWDENFAAVDVADIAEGGLKLLGTYLPDIGTQVRIAARGLDESGWVMWRAGNCCGVLLVRRIQPLAVVRANCFTRYRASQDLRQSPTSSVPFTDTAARDPLSGSNDQGPAVWDLPSAPDTVLPFAKRWPFH